MAVTKAIFGTFHALRVQIPQVKNLEEEKQKLEREKQTLEGEKQKLKDKVAKDTIE